MNTHHQLPREEKHDPFGEVYCSLLRQRDISEYEDCASAARRLSAAGMTWCLSATLKAKTRQLKRNGSDRHVIFRRSAAATRLRAVAQRNSFLLGNTPKF